MKDNINVAIYQPVKKEKHAEHYNKGWVAGIKFSGALIGLIHCNGKTFEIWINDEYKTATTHYEKAIGKLLTMMSNVSNQN
jgi:hypothetical protein